jgi:hypothetical protein
MECGLNLLYNTCSECYKIYKFHPYSVRMLKDLSCSRSHKPTVHHGFQLWTSLYFTVWYRMFLTQTVAFWLDIKFVQFWSSGVCHPVILKMVIKVQGETAATCCLHLRSPLYDSIHCNPHKHLQIDPMLSYEIK